MIFTLSLALALAGANADTNSPTTAAPVSNEASADKPEKEKKICRKLEKSASRLVKPVCKTEAEWTAFSRSNGKNWGDVKKD